jgi:hypothetical protein
MAFDPNNNCKAEQFRLAFNRHTNDDDWSISATKFVELAIEWQARFEFMNHEGVRLHFDDGSYVTYTSPHDVIKQQLH